MPQLTEIPQPDPRPILGNLPDLDPDTPSRRQELEELAAGVQVVLVSGELSEAAVWKLSPLDQIIAQQKRLVDEIAGPTLPCGM